MPQKIQVPSTGQRSTSGMVRLREKRLLPVCLFFCFIILNWKGQPAVSLFHHFWQSWCHQTAGSAGLAKDPEPLLCLQPGRVWCSLGFNHYSKKIFHPSCWWFRLALKKHRNLIGGTEILGWVNFIRCRMLDRAAFCRMIYDDTIFLWLAWPFGDDILVLLSWILTYTSKMSKFFLRCMLRFGQVC